MSTAELAQAVEAYQGHPTPAAEQAILQACEDVFRKTARSFPAIPEADAVQVARIELWRRLPNYNPARSQFPRFAKLVARCAMSQAAQKASGHGKREWQSVTKSTSSNAYRSVGGLDELEALLGTQTSVEGPMTPEEAYAQRQIRELVQRRVMEFRSTLEGLNLKVFDTHLYEGFTQAETGRRLNISQSTVARRAAKITADMHVYLAPLKKEIV